MTQDMHRAYLQRVQELLDTVPESKVRHVRDAAFWGMPVGTPIEPGMKPQGDAPKPSAPTVCSRLPD